MWLVLCNKNSHMHSVVTFIRSRAMYVCFSAFYLKFLVFLSTWKYNILWKTKLLLYKCIWTTIFCCVWIKKSRNVLHRIFNHLYSSVAQSCPTLMWPHESQHARPPCTSPTPGVHPNPCPLSRWCHPTISSPVVPFSSCPQSFPASESFQMSQLFGSGGQSIGISVLASVLPMNTQSWSPLGWTGWIALQSKGLSRGFSNTTIQKHLFFGAQLSL